MRLRLGRRSEFETERLAPHSPVSEGARFVKIDACERIGKLVNCTLRASTRSTLASDTFNTPTFGSVSFRLVSHK